MTENDDIDVKFWYNVETGQVERGEHSDYTKLIGPYDTREEAEDALEKVKRRNKAWDKEDEEEDGNDTDSTSDIAKELAEDDGTIDNEIVPCEDEKKLD